MFGYKAPRQDTPSVVQQIPAMHNIKVALFTAGLISLSLHGLQVMKHGVDSIFTTTTCRVQAMSIPSIPADFAFNSDMQPPLPVAEQAKVYRRGK